MTTREHLRRAFHFRRLRSQSAAFPESYRLFDNSYRLHRDAIAARTMPFATMAALAAVAAYLATEAI